eukprot:tig00000248_g21804.t1
MAQDADASWGARLRARSAQHAQLQIELSGLGARSSPALLAPPEPGSSSCLSRSGSSGSHNPSPKALDAPPSSPSPQSASRRGRAAGLYVYGGFPAQPIRPRPRTPPSEPETEPAAAVGAGSGPAPRSPSCPPRRVPLRALGSPLNVDAPAAPSRRRPSGEDEDEGEGRCACCRGAGLRPPSEADRVEGPPTKRKPSAEGAARSPPQKGPAPPSLEIIPLNLDAPPDPGPNPGPGPTDRSGGGKSVRGPAWAPAALSLELGGGGRGRLGAFVRSPALHVALLALVACAFAFAKFRLAVFDEGRLVRERFESTSSFVADNLKRTLRHTESLYLSATPSRVWTRMMANHVGAAGVPAADLDRARAAFLAFCGNGTLWDPTRIAGVSLLTRVEDSGRAAVEAWAGKRIVQRQPNGQPPALAPRYNDYYPITALYPFSSFGYMLDTASPGDGPRRSLILHSRDTGQTTYTNGLRVEGAIKVVFQVPLFVTPGGLISTSKEAGSAGYYGMVTGTLQIGKALHKVCETMGIEDIDVAVFNQLTAGDAGGTPSWEYIGHWKAPGRLSAPYMEEAWLLANTPERAAAAGDAFRGVELRMGQATWRLLVIARPGYTTSRRSLAVPLAFIFLGVAGTICANLSCLYSLIRRLLRRAAAAAQRRTEGVRWKLRRASLEIQGVLGVRGALERATDEELVPISPSVDAAGVSAAYPPGRRTSLPSGGEVSTPRHGRRLPWRRSSLPGHVPLSRGSGSSPRPSPPSSPLASPRPSRPPGRGEGKVPHRRAPGPGFPFVRSLGGAEERLAAP